MKILQYPKSTRYLHSQCTSIYLRNLLTRDHRSVRYGWMCPLVQRPGIVSVAKHQAKPLLRALVASRVIHDGVWSYIKAMVLWMIVTCRRVWSMYRLVQDTHDNVRSKVVVQSLTGRGDDTPIYEGFPSIARQTRRQETNVYMLRPHNNQVISLSPSYGNSRIPLSLLQQRMPFSCVFELYIIHSRMLPLLCLTLP